MAAINENPAVLDVADIEGILPNFTDANQKLEVIQKCPRASARVEGPRRLSRYRHDMSAPWAAAAHFPGPRPQ